MKIAVFSPYLDTTGGGERYILTVAAIYSEDHEVDLLLPTHLHNLKPDDYKKQVSERLQIDLEKVHFVHAPVGFGSKMIDRYFFLDRYDVLFAVTDGSIFYATSKKNILHIQTPLTVHPTNSYWGKMKVKSWDKIVYNSEFTKKHSQKYWPLPSKVIYPPVQMKDLEPGKKKDIIISVGRFFGFLAEKKHQLMIDIFKEMKVEGDLDNWQLHLVGSMGEGDKEYVQKLTESAKGFPIIFHRNLSRADLAFLYGQSKIYWHAMGYDEDDPTKMEHFGITTVEAMAAGAVPVVIKKGGQVEIVEEDKSGLFWENIPQLKSETKELIRDQKKWEKLSQGAIERAKFFSLEHFKKEILELIHN